jgi:predicted adenylyl cyclase CyaB
MARNIEIKARARDLSSLFANSVAIATSGPVTLIQKDTFYQTATGRLKLREFPGGAAELIYYERPDQPGPKKSTYTRTPVSNSASMHELLTRLLGIKAVVSKQRELFMVGNTRIHLDDVEGLGCFLELEVVLGPDETELQGQLIASDLMKQLGICEEDLVEEAYVDLLQRKTISAPADPEPAALPHDRDVV